MDPVYLNNAVAGPSKPRQPTPTEQASKPCTSMAEIPPLFLPPPGPPPNPIFMHSTEDLLRKFQLLDAYDTHVKPYISLSGESDSKQSIIPSTPGLDKGKGKEIAASPIQAVPPQTPAADAGDDDDDSGPGRKKKKNYRHLIKDIPGKHSLKKDDYLFGIMHIPPKDRIRISQFDSRTQTDAFTVSAGGIPGYNMKTIVKESNQAKEDRKKTREAKRAQLIAGSTSQSALPSPAAILHPGTPSRAGGVSTPRPSGASTPRSQAPAAPSAPGSRAGSVKPVVPPVNVPTTKVGTPHRINTPTASTPHPLSAPPLSASSLGPETNSFFAQQQMRGKKRERDDAPPTPSTGGLSPWQGTNGTPAATANHTNGNSGIQQPTAILGAKSGARRPAKRPRTDMPGQGRETTAPIQQPTPQGV